MFKCYFLRIAHGILQVHFTMVFQTSTYLSAESTEAMHIKCLSRGHNIMIHLGLNCRLLEEI